MSSKPRATSARRSPRRNDLEYCAVERPVAVCGAEQVAVGIASRSPYGKVAVIEVDQGDEGAGVGVGAGVHNLEHRTVIVRPAKSCRAEQVPLGVKDQAAVRVGTVFAVEAEQGDGGAGVGVASLHDLEHRALTRPAAICRPEQVAGGVGDQAGGRVGTVGAAVEAGHGNEAAGVGVGAGFHELKHLP
jgi:hypothetical protein